MAALATQVLANAGTEIDWTNATGGGDTAEVRAGNVLLIKNGDSSSKTTTLTTQQSVDGLAVADRAVVVAAGEIQAVPISDRKLYADANGDVALSHSATTSLQLAVITQ